MPPALECTRKIAAKTVAAGQRRPDRDYQAWIDNDRRLRQLLARLEALGAAALEADPRRDRQPPACLGPGQASRQAGTTTSGSRGWR